jgi:hypothetical protein
MDTEINSDHYIGIIVGISSRKTRTNCFVGTSYTVNELDHKMPSDERSDSNNWSLCLFIFIYSRIIFASVQ